MEERPIDRGWAWMVCLGVGINSLFLSGPLRSYGILFVEIQTRFNASGSVSSIIFVMISVGMSLTSPIAATLGERYGQRIVIAFGGFLNFTGAFLTAFAPSVEYVCVIFGIFSGLGLGCMFAPAMVMIGYYFDKRRSLANGLSMAGGSIGQMTIPVLFTYLIKTYSFQGGMLIFAALLLHIVIAAMLLRPTSTYKPVPAKTHVSSVKDAKEQNHAPEKDNDMPQNKHIFLVNEDVEKSQSLHNLHNTKELDKNHHSNDIGKSLPLLSNDRESKSGAIDDQTSRTGSLYLLSHQPLTPSDAKEIDPPPGPKAAGEDTKQNRCKSCLMFLFRLYDWSLFRDKIWILYAWSITTGQSGYGMATMFLPPFAAEKDIEAYYVSLLLTIAGATTFVGRIAGGAFADLGLIKRSALTAICLAIIGVSAFILPFVPYYPAMCVFAAIVGFVGGVYVAQIVAVVIELMGLKKMSASFGLALMVSGLMQIPVPVILGLLKDYTGTYDWAMYACSIMIVSAVPCLLVAGRMAEKKEAAKNDA